MKGGVVGEGAREDTPTVDERVELLGSKAAFGGDFDALHAEEESKRHLAW